MSAGCGRADMNDVQVQCERSTGRAQRCSRLLEVTKAVLSNRSMGGIVASAVRRKRSSLTCCAALCECATRRPLHINNRSKRDLRLWANKRLDCCLRKRFQSVTWVTE
jgi:hypothetical protein